jgi:N-carbamoylputrescine amidase
MREVAVAASQMRCIEDTEQNVARATGLVRRAAERGANIILLQELFADPYFCKDQNPEFLDLAHPRDGHPLLATMSELAASLDVVLPISFFERSGNTYFNSLVVFDADGDQLGLYRKSHIPDGPGYQEKFYFAPGDTGFKVWKTKYGDIGVGICWDQWFPEAARAMALGGAELLLYPTAIGSEPQDPEWDSRAHWQRVMQGHAAANIVPVIASNRIGTEAGDSCSVTFYGSSFITGPTGEIVARADDESEEIIIATFDLDRIRVQRRSWGLFRDRRPELYETLTRL